MEFRDLEILYTVAQSGNMTKAAQKLGYVQSNVTARIQMLERELGSTLFERTKQGVVLTEGAKQWVPHVESLLLQWNQLQTAIQDPKVPVGQLRIGCLETTAMLHGARWIADYNQRYNQVDISLRTGTTSELLQPILDRSLDVAFAAGPVKNALHTQTI